MLFVSSIVPTEHYVHVGTLMDTPIGYSASRIGPGSMSTMPSSDHDLTIQPLDSTVASPVTIQVEVHVHRYAHKTEYSAKTSVREEIVNLAYTLSLHCRIILQNLFSPT